jgi:hypothetical protein
MGLSHSLIPSPLRERVRVRVDLAKDHPSSLFSPQGKRRVRFVDQHEIEVDLCTVIQGLPY